MFPPQRAAWLALFAGLALSVASARAEYWAAGSDKYDTLKGCRFVESGADDGDSFLVSYQGKEFLFRLYAVDTPETTASYPARVNDQAAHFGITPAQALKIGEAAQTFSRRRLQGPFTVRTCWRDAKGNSRVPRYYAVVTLGDGHDLAEELAAAGLARVYGFTPGTPGFSLPKLQGIERLARSRKLGAYALVATRPAVVAANPNASRLPPTISANATPPPAPVAGAAGAKVNVNTATEAELLAVPGIGPHYAKELLAGRPYENLEAILRIKGIGPKTLTKLAPYLSAGPP